MALADLYASIDRLGDTRPLDDLLWRGLDKRRLALRDKIDALQREADPREPA